METMTKKAKYPARGEFNNDLHNLSVSIRRLSEEAQQFDKKHRPRRIVGENNELWAMLDAVAHVVSRATHIKRSEDVS